MTVTGNEVNAFIPVNVDGMFGWVATDWVERGVVNLEQTASPSQPGTATAIQAVELRDAPQVDGAALGTIPSIAVVTLTGEAQDGFLRVVYDGQEGWANAAYLEVADTSRVRWSSKPRRPRHRHKPRIRHWRRPPIRTRRSERRRLRPIT